MSSVRETVHPPEPRAVRPRVPRSTAVAGAVLLVVIAGLALAGGGAGPLTSAKAIVLGAVEGITEFLPVSSTGHLLVAQRLLGLGSGAGKTAADTYAIAIQVGAILAVVALYRTRLRSMADGVVGRDADGRRLLLRLVVAFAPAAVIGVGLGSTIKAHLFGPWPVVAAWAVGGAFLLAWRPRSGRIGLGVLTYRHAVIIGLAQTLALWPGVSRSLATLVAALALGLSISAAIEFSFLLGLATLSAATLLDLAKDGPTLLSDYGWVTPLLGALVAFVTAVLAVRWLVAHLRPDTFRWFGWYRLAIAAATAALLVAGII